jgi:adenosylhomocysteine nucleosidase
LPFVVIRAIADPLEQRLPAAARAAIGPQGEVRILPVLAMLRTTPGDLWPLLRLGWQSARAHASLRRVALLAGAALSPN